MFGARSIGDSDCKVFFRTLGQQLTQLLRDVGFLVPTDETLAAFASKELSVPQRLAPGFIKDMVEQAAIAYKGKQCILSNDERKVGNECQIAYYNVISIYMMHKFCLKLSAINR